MALLLRYATPLITGLFLVSLVSGIALFFHWGPGEFHGIHEWLSMVLILPFGLHVWKNWRPMVGYFKRPPMAIALALSLAATLAFFMPLGGAGEAGGAPPQVAIMQMLAKAKPSQIAALTGQAEQDVIDRLKGKGFSAASSELSMSEIAKASGRGDRELMMQIAALAP
jgi:Domain of unknown function (DUF4405)